MYRIARLDNPVRQQYSEIKSFMINDWFRSLFSFSVSEQNLQRVFPALAVLCQPVRALERLHCGNRRSSPVSPYCTVP